jgi:hypothetical protein
MEEVFLEKQVLDLKFNTTRTREIIIGLAENEKKNFLLSCSLPPTKLFMKFSRAPTKGAQQWQSRVGSQPWKEVKVFLMFLSGSLST